MAHLAVLEHDANFLTFTRSAVVADSSDTLDALARQRLNQIPRKPRAPESSKRDQLAIANIRNGSVLIIDNFS